MERRKKYHTDINEESLAAAKLKIYEQLNEKFSSHRQKASVGSLCVLACSDCCFDYYTIQSIEFDLIINELAKWDQEKINGLINRVDKYWNKLLDEHPQSRVLLLNPTSRQIDEVNLSIDKTSFPCVFLDETTHLCQIYEVRPFKCRIFGNAYYYPNPDEGAMGIACNRYGSILNDDNFDELLCDATEIIDKNTDLSIVMDKKRNVPIINPEYPLIYHLYQHFIINKPQIK